MPIMLRMPAVAANATHATLLAWSKQPGDRFDSGECVAEIESDKAVVEVEAPQAGRMGRQFVEAGAEVEVGAPIAELLVEGEGDAQGEPPADRPDQTQDHEQGHSRDKGASEVVAGKDPRTEAAHSAEAGSTRRPSSPLARRLAAEKGIELATVEGTGPGGRVIKVDIERHAGVVHQLTATTHFKTVPHSPTRRTIARRLVESKTTIPHFYLSIDCRMDRLIALRAELNEGVGAANEAAAAPALVRRVTVTDFIVRAVALAMHEHPAMNVAWTEDAMRQFAQTDIAVAVATEDGLITPIVRAADTKPLTSISEELSGLVKRARAGRLRPEEFQGGSIGISNLGMHGVHEFTAIINPPQSAILAVGAARRVPVVDGDELSIASVMRCTLSVDHRAIDGATAAQWASSFRRLIESPVSMLL